MINIDQLISQLTPDINLVVEFFVVFSRFEYALKESGYRSGSGTNIKANWDLLAKTLRTHFDPNSTEKLHKAVEYILNNPPRRQALVADKLEWVEDEKQSIGSLPLPLFNSIRIIRNNLFHGGKFSNGYVSNLSRDSELLNSSLTILEACLQLCHQYAPDVRQNFYH